MQASSTCNERLPLSVQIARDTSRFVIIGHRGCDPKLFRRAWWVWQWNFRFISEVTLQSPARSHGQRNVWPTRNQMKRKEKMNPLTQFQKIRILPLLIAPALAALV